MAEDRRQADIRAASVAHEREEVAALSRRAAEAEGAAVAEREAPWEACILLWSTRQSNIFPRSE